MEPSGADPKQSLGKSHRPTDFPRRLMRKTFQPVVHQLPQTPYPRTPLSNSGFLLATMKRKLDANDVPSPEAVEGKETADANDADFESLNLDPRLRQALIKEKFTKPTPVQAKAIPLALAGKDILGE